MSSVLIGLNDVSKKSYITTQSPDGHIYSYTKSYNSATYTWSGSLTAIDFTASPYSTYDAAGIVLRETGKKLYAGANPGVDRYMVGVFIIDQDGYNVSGDFGNMFIDPNCSVFAQFNGQRPTYIPTAEDDAAGTGLDLGNPVYTRGNITTTQGDITATAGNIVASAGSITSASPSAGVGYATGAGGSVIQGTSTSTLVTLNKICGQITTFTGGTYNSGTVTEFTVNNNTVATNDVVVISAQEINSTSLQIAVSETGISGGSGYFKISVTNRTGGNITLTGSIIINFVVIKAVTA